MSKEGLTKQEVKTILNFANLDVVNLLLLTVNLKEKEKEIIRNVDLLGKTREETAEILKCSVRSIYTNREKAIKKIGIALKNNKIARQILENSI